MRVLHLTSTFPRSSGGPGGTFLEDLARAQSAAGHEVVVVAPHDGGLADSEDWAAIRVRRFRYGPVGLERLAYRGGLIGTVRGPLGLAMVPFFLLGMIVGALSAGREHEVDAVHAHWWFPGGLAGVLAARRLGAPLVVTCHGSDVALATRRGLARRLGRWVLRRAAVVGVVSDALRVQVEEVFGVEATVLRMPVPLQPAPAFQGGGRAEGRIRVMAAGRLSPEKGFDVLLEALASAPEVDLELFGDGPERGALLACAKRLDLDKRVTINAALPREEYALELATADAVVVPSRTEGLGLVAVDALAAGRPVIATTAGGLPEVVGAAAAEGAGVLVEPDDADALAAALRRLPLPAPSAGAAAAALTGHLPDDVVQAHAAAYGKAASLSAVPARRFKPMRWLGLAAGLALLVAVLTTATDDVGQLRDALTDPDPRWLAAAALAALAAEAAFALASAVAGRSLAADPPALGRTAATYLVAQQAKHLPGGIWPAVARAGMARRLHPRYGARLSFVWVALESLASVAAGLLGGGAVLVFGAGSPRSRTWGGLAVAAGLIALIAFRLARRTLLARLLEVAGRPAPSLVRLSIAHLPAWAFTGATSAALASAVGATDFAAATPVAAAAVVASVAGFLVLPVPAGLGVREAVFVALAAPVLAAPAALVVALAARLFSMGAQLALAGAAFPLVRRINAPGRSDAPRST